MSHGQHEYQDADQQRQDFVRYSDALRAYLGGLQGAGLSSDAERIERPDVR